MEPEVRELALEWLADTGHPEALVVGGLYNIARTFRAAAERANLPPVRPNLGLRASHASLLLARGYSYEYVRIVLGHVHEVRVHQLGDHLVARAAKHGTTLSHYMRPSPDILRPRG
jgi:integrase